MMNYYYVMAIVMFSLCGLSMLGVGLYVERVIGYEDDIEEEEIN